jgi:hypothetical protein
MWYQEHGFADQPQPHCGRRNMYPYNKSLYKVMEAKGAGDLLSQCKVDYYFFALLCMNNKSCGTPLGNPMKNGLDYPINVNLGKQIENIESKMFEWGVWSEAYIGPYVKGGRNKTHFITENNVDMTKGVFYPIVCLFVWLVNDLKVPDNDKLFLTEEEKNLFKNPELPMEGPTGHVVKRYSDKDTLIMNKIGFDFSTD